MGEYVHKQVTLLNREVRASVWLEGVHTGETAIAVEGNWSHRGNQSNKEINERKQESGFSLLEEESTHTEMKKIRMNSVVSWVGIGGIV